MIEALNFVELENIPAFKSKCVLFSSFSSSRVSHKFLVEVTYRRNLIEMV